MVGPDSVLGSGYSFTFEGVAFLKDHVLSLGVLLDQALLLEKKEGCCGQGCILPALTVAPAVTLLKYGGPDHYCTC